MNDIWKSKCEFLRNSDLLAACLLGLIWASHQKSGSSCCQEALSVAVMIFYWLVLNQLNLNHYFNPHVSLSICHLFVCLSQFWISNSCCLFTNYHLYELLCVGVKSEKYVFLVTLRLLGSMRPGETESLTMVLVWLRGL